MNSIVTTIDYKMPVINIIFTIVAAIYLKKYKSSCYSTLDSAMFIFLSYLPK